MMMKTVLKLVMLGVMMIGINTGAGAALIDGSMGITGGYSVSGGTDMSDATTLSLNTVTGTSGTGDILSTVTFGTVGSVNNGSFSFAPFAPAANVFEIGGYTLNLTSLNIVDQTSSLLTLNGTGSVSGNGFDITGAIWTLSAQAGSSYSMTVTTVVPVPAAVWLFGSGLLGLVGVARRKTA